MRIPGIRHPEGVKRPRQSVSPLLPISGKSADLLGYLLFFLLFQELRFLCLCKESSKESTRRRGERNLPALRSTPLRAKGLRFRSSAAAQDADLPALLLKCFELETRALSPMQRGETCSE